MSPIRQIDGSNFLDSYRLWNSIQGIKSPERLRTLMTHAGVVFHDPNTRNFISEPVVGITGFGGIPVCWGTETPPDHIALGHLPGQSFVPRSLVVACEDMMGFGGFCTYLNPRDNTPSIMVDSMISQGHTSTAHSIVINFMVLGVSLAAESELNCQRDIIHLARVTEARTLAQSHPPVVVQYPEMVWMYQNVYAHVEHVIGQAADRPPGASDLDLHEATNLIFPAAKGTVFILTGSVRNLQKLVSLGTDPGKENEVKRVLDLIKLSMAGLFPRLFS